MTFPARPIIPQTLIGFSGSLTPRIPPAPGNTVILLLTHDWGPLGSDAAGSDGKQGGPQLLFSFQDWTDLFGDSDTVGRTAVAGCFAGQGLPGLPGAGAVYAYRMGAGAVAASVTIQTSGGSPTAALTLAALYKGTRGNGLGYIIDTDPGNPSVNDRLRITFNGVVVETYVYAQTDVIGLTNQIVGRSRWVKPTNVESTPTRLAASAGAALTGGTDGSAPAAADHIAAQSAVQYLPAGIIAAVPLTDPTIQASYTSWLQAQDTAQRPMRMVWGGVSGESIGTAVANAQATADEHVIRFGGGTWHDDLLGKDLSTAQLAPRIAGILAAKGAKSSLTAAKIAGLHAVPGATLSDQDIATAVQNGVTTLTPTGAQDAELRIAKGVSTWTSNAVPNKPLNVFGDPRLVGILDDFKRGMSRWGNEHGIGKPVNDDSRAQVYGEVRRREDALLLQGLIMAGDDVLIPKPFANVINTDGDPVNGDTIPFEFGWQFTPTTNAILGQGTIR